MVKCTRCQATLPDFATSCQFCGNVLSAPPRAAGRPGIGVRLPQAASGTPNWVYPAYYAIAGWWVLSGLWTVLGATVFATAKHGGGGIFAIIFGGLGALIGLGLLARVDVVRGIVNFFCFVQILFGLFGVVILFFAAPFAGIWGAIALLHEFLDIGLAGLMIFLIGETEARAPNY